MNASRSAVALAVLALGALAVSLRSETLTLTTSYPAPSGVYNLLVTRGQTTLARDGGTVTVGPGGPPGTGTTLDGAGNISANGSITVPNGSLSAGQNVTANGNVWAGGSLTANTGNVTAQNGSVWANNSVTAQNGDVWAGGNVTANTGSLWAAGNVTANSGNVSASQWLTSGAGVWTSGPITAGWSINTNGRLGVQGFPADSYCCGLGGGVNTWDVYAHGGVYAGYGGNINSVLRNDGTVWGTNKLFRIDHPSKPGYKLIHSSVEGPEAAVFYRGEGRLTRGEAEIRLPDYFEALTRKEGRTATLTAKGSQPYLLSYTDIRGGRFKVYGTKEDGEFSWEIKATRADIPPIEVEVPNERDPVKR